MVGTRATQEGAKGAAAAPAAATQGDEEEVGVRTRSSRPACAAPAPEAERAPVTEDVTQATLLGL